jgi:hypothetical protein
MVKADSGRARDVAENGRRPRLWLAGLAVGGADLALSAGAHPATTAVNTLISPQYQAENGRPAVGAGLHGAGAAVPRSSGRRASTVGRRHPPAAWYRSRNVQYQLSSLIAKERDAELLITSLLSRHERFVHLLAEPSVHRDIERYQQSRPRDAWSFVQLGALPSSWVCAVRRCAALEDARPAVLPRPGEAPFPLLRGLGRGGSCEQRLPRRRLGPTSALSQASAVPPTCTRRSPVRRLRGAAGLCPRAPRAPASTEELSQ